MFSSHIIYFELFIALFFLPGFFITVILGIKKFRFLLSFALSYSLLVLTLLPFEYYAQPIVRWQWCVLLEWVILAALAVVKTLMYGHFNLVGAPLVGDRLKMGTRKRGPYIFLGLLSPRLTVPLVLAGMICGYLAYAGIYLEIPSDAWNHVFRFQWHKSSFIDNGAFPSGSLFVNLLLIQGQYWHISHWNFIHAWLCHVSNLSIMDLLYILTFVNITIFLLGFYYFGLFLFAGLRISAFKKMLMAAVASLFAAATMGNMVFAYIRYYAFAPAILNYVLFLAAMAVIVVWLRSHHWLGAALWIAPIIIIATNMVHTQEALFIFIMTLALSLWETIRTFWRKIFSIARHSRKQNVIPAKAGIQGWKLWIPIFMGMTKWKGDTVGQTVRGNHWTVREWKSVILTIVLLLVFFAGFAAARYFKPASWISSSMIMPHVNIPSEPVSFIFRNLMISVPENPCLRLAAHQFFVFYQVVGCWGLFVYLLFFLMLRRFVKLSYLMAGMVIVPFLTAFNPLTVDMMARLGQDPSIYRFHYLIPLPFVGGYLFVHFWDQAREWLQKMRAAPAESVSSIWPRLSLINFIGCIVVLAGLIGMVFPINAAGIYAPYSKIYTLRKIPAGNDYHLWADLGKVIKRFEGKIILTDNLTRLMTYSQINHCPYSEWLNSRNPEKDPPEPYTWEFLRGRGVIIINRRDGAPSITGRIARHWPEDVLKVSRYYSPEAQNYLESHPEMFRKIWSQNRIAVYAVR